MVFNYINPDEFKVAQVISFRDEYIKKMEKFVTCDHILKIIIRK